MANLTIVHQREALLNTYKGMGLKNCGEYDYQKGLGSKQTGWGVVSQERAQKGISRSKRIATGKGKRGGKK